MRRTLLAAVWLSWACHRPPAVEAAPVGASAGEVATTPTASHRVLHATILGRPLGRVTMDREPLPGGGERWTTRTELTLALDDPGESAKAMVIVETVEYAPGQVFVRSREHTTEDGVEESLDTEVRGDVLHVHVRGPAHDETRTLPLPADFTNELAVYQRLRGEVEAGAALPHGADFVDFDDETEALQRNRLTLLERTTEAVDGQKLALWKVESRDHEDQRAVAWLDADGMPVRLEIGVFVAGLAPIAAPADPAELSSYLEVAGRVPGDAERLTLTVTVAHDDAADAPVFRDNAYQKVTRKPGAYTLVLAARHGDALAPRAFPLVDVPADVRGFLAATATSQADDPDIVARAKQLADGAADARAAAVAIVQWVHDNLGKRDGTRGAATAVETLAAGFGDCTEHAALAVALLRAAGLPARNAGGIVLVPGFFGAEAGYHAWVEVWLGDWVALDPALGRMHVAAHYILLGHDEPGMNSGSGALSRLIGRTTIAVVP